MTIMAPVRTAFATTTVGIQGKAAGRGDPGPLGVGQDPEAVPSERRSGHEASPREMAQPAAQLLTLVRLQEGRIEGQDQQGEVNHPAHHHRQVKRGAQEAAEPPGPREEEEARQGHLHDERPVDRHGPHDSPHRGGVQPAQDRAERFLQEARPRC